MVNSTTVTKSKPSMNGMLFCANCGSEMLNTGQRYYCPNTTVESGGKCPTKPVDARYLLHKVVTRIISRLATEETISHITESIKDSTAVSAGIQHRRMEQAEAAIAKANARRPAILHPVEHGAKTYYDVAEEISQLDQITTGLAVESMVARNELDKIDFIRDEDGIRETASNPDTYLEGNNPDEAQELLDLLVRKVRVDTESAVIIYNTAIPSAEQPEGIHEDLVALN